MSSIWLEWREAQGEELPMTCSTCGRTAVRMVTRKLRTIRPGFMCIVKTTVSVVLPYCTEHVRASWNGWVRVRAKAIGTDGITLTQLSGYLVEAVERFRRHPTEPRALNGDRPPRTRNQGPRRPRRSPAPTNITLWLVFGAVILVAMIVVGTCGFGLLFVNRNPGPPGFRQPAVPNNPGPAKAPWRRSGDRACPAEPSG